MSRPTATPRRPSRRQMAVALGYEAGVDTAPVILAKGSGRLAVRILEAARQADGPVRTDRDLVEMLAAVDLGEAIPPELYLAVAELLAFIYRVNSQAGEMQGGQPGG